MYSKDFFHIRLLIAKNIKKDLFNSSSSEEKVYFYVHMKDNKKNKNRFYELYIEDVFLVEQQITLMKLQKILFVC